MAPASEGKAKALLDELHAKHNAQNMKRPKEEKSEARWRDYAADHYFHYYYRYGEDEKGSPLADDHRTDDLLAFEHAAQSEHDSAKNIGGSSAARELAMPARYKQYGALERSLRAWSALLAALLLTDAQ